MNFTNEILAKLMSSEDIGVTYGNVTTAYFNTETRTLVLPNWEGLKEIELQLLIAHEIGHALFTPPKEWTHYVKINPSNFKDYLNVVEDARIEKMVKNKFPGTKKVFYYGYSALGERSNIFPEDTKDYHFLDFLNVYFKFGVLRELDLNNDHKYFINKMEQMESFNDVYAVAKELYDFCANQPQPLTSTGSYALSQASEKDGSGGSMDASSDQKSKSSNSKSKKKSKNKSGNNNGQSDSDKDGDQEKLGKQSAARSGSHGSRSSNTSQQINKEPVTIDSLEDVLKTLVSNKKNIVASVPDPILENIIRPYKSVLMDFELAEMRSKSKTPLPSPPAVDEHADKIDGLELLDEQELKEMTSMNALKTFLNNNAPSINYHKQLFEMRKKAIEHNRTMTYRSGLLDMNKMYSYKYEDQIFKTFQVKQTGKKHGLIFFLDMSSSMISYFRSALKKMLEIVLFCRESGIPFNVYGFTTHTFNTLPRFKNYGNMEYRLGFTEGFSLIELLSYKMTNSEFRKAFDIIFKKIGINTTVDGYGLYGTPLNETVLCLDPIVKKFKNDTNSQIVNVVFFTDGYGSGYGFNLNKITKTEYDNYSYSWYQESNYVIYDTKSKNNFVIDDFKHIHGGPQRQTAVLLAVMKKRMPYVNIMNYYITWDLFDLTNQEFLDKISQRTFVKKQKINYNYNDRLQINRYLDQEQICVIDKCNGFDQAYILTPGFLRKEGSQKRGKIKTTQKSSKEEFKGQSANKKKQNKLISDFINMIV